MPLYSSYYPLPQGSFGPLIPSPFINKRWVLGALVLSVVMHLVMALVVPPLLTKTPTIRINEGIDVILVNSQSLLMPDHVQALAQFNLDGGGTSQSDDRAKTNRLLGDAEQEAIEINTLKKNRQVHKQPNYLSQKNMDSRRESFVVPRPFDKADKAIEHDNPFLDQQTLEDETYLKTEAISRLRAEINDRIEAYNKRPRKTFVGARTLSSVEADYVEAWRRKVEEVGSQQFPYVSGHPMYGRLVLSVTIGLDGHIRKIEVDRPSPIKELNEAAKKTLIAAAPFGAFPPAMRAITDLIVITRTWFYTQDQVLRMEN